MFKKWFKKAQEESRKLAGEVFQELDSAEAYLERGFRWLEEQDANSALRDFEAAARLAPNEAQPLVAQVVALQQLQRPRETITLAKQALQQAPHNFLARHILVELLSEQEQLPQAMKWVNEGIAQRENRLQYAHNDPTLRQEDVERLQKEMAELRFQRANLHLAKQDTAAAEADLNSALETLPEKFSGLLNRATLRLKLHQDPEGALQDVEAALTAGPHEPREQQALGYAHLLRARCRLALNQKKQVCADLRKASNYGILEARALFMEHCQ